MTLLACLTLFCPRADAAKKTPSAAKLTHIVGLVTFESGDSKGAAIEGQALKSDDWVETDKGATAVVELADGSAFKLRESSRFQLELPEPKTSVTSVLLSWGGVFAKVAKVLPGARFDVHTETAVASVRGTEFFVSFGRPAKKGRDLWVCVNKGAVNVTTNASKTGLLVPAGKGILIKSGLDLTKPQAYEWTKKLNWNMDPKGGSLEDKTNLDSAYSDLLDQDYR
jgi:hypothetical protein